MILSFSFLLIGFPLKETQISSCVPAPCVKEVALSPWYVRNTRKERKKDTWVVVVYSFHSSLKIQTSSCASAPCVLRNWLLVKGKKIVTSAVVVVVSSTPLDRLLAGFQAIQTSVCWWFLCAEKVVISATLGAIRIKPTSICTRRHSLPIHGYDNVRKVKQRVSLMLVMLVCRGNVDEWNLTRK